MNRLPTLFVSHGSPMLAIERDPTTDVWTRLGRELPRPRAILIASAHWSTRAPMTTASARPETIHDFYGFPEPLYRLRYPAPGAPELAARACELIYAAGLPAAMDRERGLDHGAWAPLRYLYPEADIPVTQVSLQSPQSMAHHLQLGRALASLADEDVLVIGSGNLTHNLRDAFGASSGGQSGSAPFPYALEFQAWMKARLESNDFETLADYHRRAPHAARAHPTDEHLAPLYVALGAAGESVRAQCLYDGFTMGALAMDVWLFHPA